MGIRPQGVAWPRHEWGTSVEKGKVVAASRVHLFMLWESEIHHISSKFSPPSPRRATTVLPQAKLRHSSTFISMAMSIRKSNKFPYISNLNYHLHNLQFPIASSFQSLIQLLTWTASKEGEASQYLGVHWRCQQHFRCHFLHPIPVKARNYTYNSKLYNLI